MKAKKIIALAMSAAMVVGTAACLTACTPKDDNGGKGGYVEDTRIWYAVGKDSKGTLKNQGWNQDDATYRFVRDTTVVDENVFTLELDIYAGDIGSGLSFKFLYKNTEDEKGDWTHQYGIHNFEGSAGYEGEDLDSVIKIEGVTVFTTASDNGDNGSNMQLAKGQEGTYKFTLKTQNDTDAPKLSVERVKKIEVSHDMYITGHFNFFDTLTSNRIAMTENVGSDTVHTTWSAQINVEDDHLWLDDDGKEVEASAESATVPNGTGKYAAIQIVNNRKNDEVCTTLVEGSDYKTATVEFEGTEYKSILLPKGSYTIVYDQVDNKVTITAGTHKMYLRGGLEGMSWSENKEEYILTESKDGSYWSTYFTAAADGEIKLYNGLKSGDNGWVGVGNIAVEAGKTYAIKFTLEGEKVEYEEIAYYLVGTFVDEDGNNVNFGDKGIVEGVHPKFTKEGNLLTATFTAIDVTGRDGYTWIVDQNKPGVFGVQIVCGTTVLGVKDWGVAGSGDNIFVQAGTWTVTVDTTNWTYTVTAAQA